MIKIIFLALSFSVLISCSTPGQKEKITDASNILTLADSFPAGQIISNVFAKNETSLSYSLFLPSGYSSTKKWPLLILFDAQTRGTLPLELYKTVAEHNGFILMCSNDSRNGNPPELTEKIIASMLSEGTTRFSTHNDMIFTGGFSGGARIAALCAMQNQNIKGVIGVSAGFPTNQFPNRPFRFIGIAGKDDFNYKELIELDNQLLQLNYPHFLFIHNGKHDWCPAELINNAMLLLASDAMRDKTIPINKKMLEENKQSNLEEAKQLMAAHHYTDAKIILNFILECNKGLDATDDVSKELSKLVQSKAFQKQEKELNELLKTENTQLQSFVQSIGKPINWWQEEVNKIRAKISAVPESEYSYMLKRVLGGVSIQCYMYAQHFVNTSETANAAYIVELYKLVDPENKDPWFFSAALNARNGKNEAAINDLYTSITNGFTDTNRLLNDVAFQSLLTQPSFSELLAKIPAR